MDAKLPLPRSVPDLWILQALSRGESRAGDIARWIRDATGGVLDVEVAALHPALRRLERRGWVEPRRTATESGRAVREYALTGSGARELSRAPTSMRTD